MIEFELLLDELLALKGECAAWNSHEEYANRPEEYNVICEKFRMTRAEVLHFVNNLLAGRRGCGGA